MDFKRVLADLYAEKGQVEKAIEALEALNGTAGAAPVRRGRKPGMSVPAAASHAAATSTRRGRRTMNAAARKRQRPPNGQEDSGRIARDSRMRSQNPRAAPSAFPGRSRPLYP